MNINNNIRLSSLYLISLPIAFAMALVFQIDIVRILIVIGILGLSFVIRMFAFGNVSIGELSVLLKTPRSSLQRAIAGALPIELVIVVVATVLVLNP